ncbi:MAG: ISNCY family transposase [Treponema sp.]|jgi:transposase|nr:ISNCY family transposase [Treponema sp.]
MLKEQEGYTRAYLIKAACAGGFTAREAAERLKLSIGRIDQLKRRYRKVGDAAFTHGNKGRIPVNKIPDNARVIIIATKLSEIYQKANFAHFAEILEEDTGLKYSYSAIRQILIAAGHKSPKTRRTRKQLEVHPPRPRRECFGEMLQGDASPFDWFDNGQEESLHGYIDDATGTVTGLFMAKHECLLGYLEVTRQTVTAYGIPAELYLDKASVFFVNKKDKENLTREEQLEGLAEKKTRLGQIMEELGVNMHPAHTPQSKGRIERLWETLQSRLVIEFKRHGITTIEQANAFLPYYMQMYNTEFAIQPANNKSMFIHLYDTSVLDTLLVAKVSRKTDNTGVFSFHNHKFLVPDPDCRGKTVDLIMSEKIGFKAMLGNKLCDIQYCDYYDNRHIKTHMPEVTKIFIEKYLKANAKETTRNDKPIFFPKSAER